jgi:hypothetical protein
MTHALRVVAVSSIAACAFTACDNDSQLQIHHANQLVFSRQLEEGQKLAIGAEDLGQVVRLPMSLGFTRVHLRYDDPVVVFDTTLGGPDITLYRQFQAHLFMRDPHEVFENLAGLADDHARFHRLTWRHETSSPSSTPAVLWPWRLPDAVVMPHPYGPQFLSVPNVLRPIDQTYFWRNNNRSTWAGPANEPEGSGSIKALRILPSGLCSATQPLDEVVNSVGRQVSMGFLRGTCKPDESDGELYYLDAISYLAKQRPDRQLPGDDDAGGGFILQGRVRVHDSGIAAPLSLDDCSVGFNYDYRFHLADGRLAVAPARNQLEYDVSLGLCSGVFGVKGVAERLAEALEREVPGGVAALAGSKQVYSRPVPEWDCRVNTPIEEACRTAIDQFGLAVTSGADVLGIPTVRALQLAAAAKRPENWQCPLVDKCRDRNGHCQFVVRAKRLNVTPQEVELVWFDDVDEYDNPALALFAASFVRNPDDGAVDYNLYRTLCSRAPTELLPGPEQARYVNHAFRNFRQDNLRCDALPPPDPNPPRPPPLRPVCPCRSNAECPSGVPCDVRRGRCEGVCVQHSDCAMGYCDTELGLCTGGQCVYPYNDRMCYSYEKCQGDPSAYGICVLKKEMKKKP